LSHFSLVGVPSCASGAGINARFDLLKREIHLQGALNLVQICYGGEEDEY